MSMHEAMKNIETTSLFTHEITQIIIYIHIYCSLFNNASITKNNASAKSAFGDKR